MSTTTAPSPMPSTMAEVSSTGALRPGTAAGATAAPSRSTHMPATISSSQSGSNVPDSPMSPSTLATLRAKRKLAWVGMPEGGLAMPTTWTPL